MGYKNLSPFIKLKMPNHQRVYIGGIPTDARDRDLEKFFKGYGRINEVVIKNGYGFVEFDDYRDADDAVSDLDGKDMQGGRVRVELARDPRDRRRERGGGGFGRGGRDGRRGNPPGPKTNYRLVVENISSRTSWQDLKDYFRTAGEITYTNAHSPRSGEGIVEFATKRGLEYALKYQDELELDGRRLKVYEETRGGGGFGRGGRDRSRSRSRSRSRGRRSRSRSDSRGRSKSRSNSRDRSKSRSPRDSGRNRSRSRSTSRSKDNRDKNGDRSPSRERDVSRSRSRSHSRSRSRSRSN